MTPEQLEIVFDTLDVEQKGYLTLDQFLERFSEYNNILFRSISRGSFSLFSKGREREIPGDRPTLVSLKVKFKKKNVVFFASVTKE